MKEEKPFVFWQLVYIKVAACQKINFGVFFDIHENQIKSVQVIGFIEKLSIGF